MPASLRVEFALYGANWSLSLKKTEVNVGDSVADSGKMSSDHELWHRRSGVSETDHGLGCLYHGTVRPPPTHTHTHTYPLPNPNFPSPFPPALWQKQTPIKRLCRNLRKSNSHGGTPLTEKIVVCALAALFVRRRAYVDRRPQPEHRRRVGLRPAAVPSCHRLYLREEHLRDLES